ncbi:MAG: TonB-dependent vitamin B12 receptor [Luteimonas sp.]
MQSHEIKSRRRVLMAALSIACAQAHAQDDKTLELDRIVVTASRTPQAEDETLASITVIDREQIDRLQPASLPELLRGMPGIAVANNGGPGKQSSVFVRGASGSQVLVLVDGIRIGSATAGLAAFQDIPVDQIERIEIARGPFSSLYGSEALGGVIQIFTRRPEGAFSPHFSASIGSFGTRRGSAGIAGKAGNGWYSLTAAHEETDGINACRGSGTLFVGCFTDEPDEDGYRNDSVSLQGGYRFSDAWDAEARILRAEGSNEYDGGFSNQADVVQQAGGARLRYAPNKRVALTLDVARSVDESDDYKNGRFVSRFDTHRDLASLQADIGAGGGLYSVGFDWQRDAVDGRVRFDETQRINRAVFGQWQQAFGANHLQASVRRDDNSQFGGETTGSLRWGVDLNETLKLVASYGTAYRAPTFNDLYFPNFSNPNLHPETSRSAEIALRGTRQRIDWSIAAYRTRADDLITFDSMTFLPANVARAQIRGAEATVGIELAGWNLNGNVTWLDPRNESPGGNFEKLLPRRPRQSARVDVDRGFGALSIGGSVNASGERYDDLANRARLAGYATADLRIGYAFNTAWTLQANAANVFDRQYETAAYFNQPGRNYTLSLRYRPTP